MDVVKRFTFRVFNLSPSLAKCSANSVSFGNMGILTWSVSDYSECGSKHLLSRRVDAERLASTFYQLGHRQSFFFHRRYIVTSEPQRITSFLPYTEILQNSNVSVDYSDINLYITLP